MLFLASPPTSFTFQIHLYKPSCFYPPLTPCCRMPNVGGYNSRGFVEVLAASQTTTTKEWFQGTADAVRQYMWLFDEACRDGVEDFLILSGESCC